MKQWMKKREKLMSNQSPHKEATRHEEATSEHCQRQEIASGGHIQAYVRGTRIQCKGCGEKGTIIGWRFNRRGQLDNVPYTVRWDRYPGFNTPSCHAFSPRTACHAHIELAGTSHNDEENKGTTDG